MGNKVVKIQEVQPPSIDELADMEVYKDVSTVSERVNTRVWHSEDGKYRPNFVQKMHVAREVNVRAVFDSLRNIFTWIPGERVLNPDFGSRLMYYLYEGITPENKERIAAEVKGVCLKWEPRVQILSVRPVESVSDTEDNTVTLDIVFRIPSLSDEQYRYSYTYNRAS